MKAIIAGAFDPFTLGHYNIVKRAVAVLGEAIIAVAEDTGKNVVDIETRTKIVSKSIENLQGVSVATFNGLLSEFLKSNMPCVLVRGLRGVRDCEYERDLSRVYGSQCDCECVYLIADGKTEHISSTVVRQLAELDAPLDGYVCDNVKNIVKAVYCRRGE